MKRVLSFALVLVLLCATAYAGAIESVPGHIKDTLGYAPESTEQAVKVNALNLILGDDDQAVLSWTDANHSRVYGVQDSKDILASLYIDLSAKADWEACTFYVGTTPLAGYNSTAGSVKNFTSMEDYMAFVSDYFGIPSYTAVGDSLKDSAMTYVLNTNTHKFHYPDCPSVKKMKDKNRRDYTGTRDEIILQGYDPCGNCKP